MTSLKQTLCRQLARTAVRWVCVFLLGLLPGLLPPSLAAGPAAAPAPEAALTQAVQQWVARQQGGRPEQVQLMPLDTRVRVQPCEGALAMDHPFASTETIRVRCGAPSWQLYVRLAPVPRPQVATTAAQDARRAVVVSVQPLVRGMTVQSADVRLQEVVLPPGGGSFLEQATEALHSEVMRDIPAGTPLRRSDLRPLVLVKRGQLVQITADKKTGFMVTAHVEAMQDGRMGEQIKLKNPESGRILTGVVRGPGTVDGL